jgi:hypothetical protein
MGAVDGLILYLQQPSPHVHKRERRHVGPTRWTLEVSSRLPHPRPELDATTAHELAAAVAACLPEPLHPLAQGTVRGEMDAAAGMAHTSVLPPDTPPHHRTRRHHRP